MLRSHTRSRRSFCPNLFFRSSYFTRSKLLLGSDGHEEDDDDDDDDDGDNDVVVVMIMRIIMLRSRSMKKMRIMMI